MRIVDGTRRLIRAPEVAFDAGEIGLDRLRLQPANIALVAALEARRRPEAAIRRIDALAEAVDAR